MPVVHSRPTELTHFTNESTACTLFKGTHKQAAFTCHVPWTLQDQQDLLQVYNVRQVRRQETRMFLKEVVYAFASKHTYLTQDSSIINKAVGSEYGEEPNDSGRGGGRSRKRSQPDESDPDLESDAPPPAKKGKDSKRKKTDDTEGQEDSDGEDEDDANGGDGKKKASKKKAEGGKDRKIPSLPTTASTLKADQEVSSQAAEILQANDPAMKNARRIAEKLKDLKLKEVVKPLVTDKSEQPLANVLSQPAISGRDVKLQQIKKEAEQWSFQFKRGPGHTGKKGNIKIPISYGALPKDASDDEQEQLAGELARLCNAWPWDDDELKPGLLQQLIPIAMSNIWARPLQVDEVYHGDTEVYRTQVHYIDSQTGSRESVTIAASATAAAMKAVCVPARPALSICQKTSNKKGRGGGKISDRTVITFKPDQPHHTEAPVFKKDIGKTKSSPRWAQLRAEDAVYWLAAQLQGLVASPARIKELHVLYRRQIGLQKAARSEVGIYGGKSDMYHIAWNKPKLVTMVMPTQKIAKDMDLTTKSLALYVHSLNASRATPVMESLIQLFCAGNDIRHVWIEAAKIADLVNLDIGDNVAPSSQCDCDDSAVGVEMHPCERCTHPTICKGRAFDSMGRLVCPRCQGRDVDTFGRPSRAPGKSLTAYLVHESLWKNFKRECLQAGHDPTSTKFKAVFEDAWKQLRERLPGKGVGDDLALDKARQYTDEYTGSTHDAGDERTQIGSNPSRRRYVPCGLTVDAIRRQGRPSNSHLKYSGDNLAITSNACQMGKQVFNAGVLHEIGEFKRSADQASHTARKGLVNRLTAMAVVNCKRPYINAGKGSLEEKYDKIHAEAVAGRPTPGENGPWDSKAKQYIQKQIPAYKPGEESIWDEETWQASQDCAKSMEKYFGVKLYRLKDGTAWAGTEYTTPANLDRNSVAVFCLERLERMRTCCNKKWQTTDSDEKLYREILFQYCCSHTTKPELQYLKKKYGDRLGLPLVIWMHTPLRLSIAHRLHGFGMLTGWVSDHATDVQERIDNNENNNMLIESWYVNCSKFDMAEDYYDELDDILSKAKILNKAIYDPASWTSLVSKAAVAPSTAKVDAKDEYAGAPFELEDVAVAEEETIGQAKDVKEGQSTAAPQAFDDDEEMPDIGATTGADVEGVEGEGLGGEDEIGGSDEYAAAGGADVGGIARGGESGLNADITAIYQQIFDHEGLRDQLLYDPDFRTLLGQLQMAANDPTDPEAQDQFDMYMGQIYENYFNQIQQE